MDPATISALAGAAQGIVGGIGGVITYGSRKRELERQQAERAKILKDLLNKGSSIEEKSLS